MAKIQISENDIRQMVCESVKKVLKEMNIDDIAPGEAEAEFAKACDIFDDLGDILDILLRNASEEDFRKWSEWLYKERDDLRKKGIM